MEGIEASISEGERGFLASVSCLLLGTIPRGSLLAPWGALRCYTVLTDVFFCRRSPDAPPYLRRFSSPVDERARC